MWILNPDKTFKDARHEGLSHLSYWGGEKGGVMSMPYAFEIFLDEKWIFKGKRGNICIIFLKIKEAY